MDVNILHVLHVYVVVFCTHPVVGMLGFLWHTLGVSAWHGCRGCGRDLTIDISIRVRRNVMNIINHAMN